MIFSLSVNFRSTVDTLATLNNKKTERKVMLTLTNMPFLEPEKGQLVLTINAKN